MRLSAQYNLGINPVKRVEIDIGNWNMDLTPAIDVDVGIEYTRWRHIFIMIIEDNGIKYTSLTIDGLDSGFFGHYLAKPNTVMSINSAIGGYYDSVSYDSVLINRGFISLEYE